MFSDGVVVKSGVIAGELAELRQSAERTRVQLTESLQREKVLVRRLAAKEQETQDYVVSRAGRQTYRKCTTRAFVTFASDVVLCLKFFYC